MRVAFGHVWWGREWKRRKGVRLLGRFPGPSPRVRFGIQVSFGIWHFYPLVEGGGWR